MPDHIHLIGTGLGARSDQWLASRFLREHLTPMIRPAVFQHQPYDRVLRETDRQRDAFERAAIYLLQNPEREGLVDRYHDYPFCGCVIPGYPELDPRKGDYWDRFWRAHAYLCKQHAR